MPKPKGGGKVASAFLGSSSMTRWTPDPSFYPSPRLGGEGAGRNARLCRGLRSEARRSRCHRRGRRRSGLADLFEDRRPGRHDRRSATSCTIMAGTRAARVSAPTRRIRISSGATSWCRVCAPRASTSSTPSPTREARRSCKVIEPEEVIEATGYSRPHTVHCGPDGIYVSALGNAKGDGAGRHLPHGLRDLRGARPLGG